MVGRGQYQGGLEAVSGEGGPNEHLAAGAATELGDGLEECLCIPGAQVTALSEK